MFEGLLAPIGHHTSYWMLGGIIVCGIIDKAIRARRRNPRLLPRPPGPKGLPILGSALEMPREQPWLVYDQWFKVYGDMVYFEVLGQPFLVLGSLRRTTDLFDRRSSIYSDRPRMPMLIELMFAATIMRVVYGIRIKDSTDPSVAAAEKALEILNTAGTPGAFLVDVLPILKYVPSWLPGAGFKKKAAKWKKYNTLIVERPFQRVEELLREGEALPSMASALLERLPERNDPSYVEERKLGQNATCLAYLGGADTTLSAVHSFFLAMILYPEVQRKAQAELDLIVGQHRLPDFSDYDFLPYINALAKETMRWHLVTPLAIPHRCTEDNEYDGFFIPKGTIVMGNAWTILHDPVAYPSPSEFRPERFLKDGKLDPTVRSPDCAAFGFGRRICPGRHMSNNSLYCVISSFLAVYNISAPLDSLGNPVDVQPEFNDGLVSFPLPFKCTIKPRSPQAEALIRSGIEMD
ncbi:Cytochrome P450 monooxygenase COX2 [Psilocybe cubensis]|uniref:Cytochrome P450 monooxygenase COX2 n=1 Tax=Psilocybe cubensis TaxID=181762 RepID=A0ACB8H735_PSICU|nr:Cytochrome P450 monooxygenase COX2 [Psilocybe cubensis]KAH9483726.1 Cytochrome P450 monooxygenase COX2 [Psilocybe cubensis]